MGDCIYCGQPAGFLRKRHQECERKEEERLAGLRAAEEALSNNVRYYALQPAFDKARLDGFVKEASDKGVEGGAIRTAIIKGWQLAVDRALEDGVLSNEEEQRLMRVAELTGYTQQDMNGNGAWQRLGQAAILRDLMEGKLPQRVKINGGGTPFALQKSEAIIWLENNVAYYETKVRRQFVGGSTGVSVRIAKGVYLRQSAFRGEPVYSEETVHVANGMLAVTDKHIYFHGGTKSLRIPFKKIVSFTPYSDGFGLCKDGVNAREQKFGNANGWFLYNLVTNVPNIED